MRHSRGLHVVIGAMGVALLLMTWQYLMVSQQVEANREGVRQLVKAVEVQRQELLAQRRLVRALQQQVRECRRHPHHCGPPLTEPPSPRTHRGTTALPTGSPSSSPPTGGRSPSPTPTRSPRPQRSPRPSSTPSPSPSPSPTPTCDLQHPLRCVPGAT